MDIAKAQLSCLFYVDKIYIHFKDKYQYLKVQGNWWKKYKSLQVQGNKFEKDGYK